MRELIIDSFAGGGGASTGIELALGRSPDVAINHDTVALAMHEANHPETRHMPHSIWKVDPLAVCGGKPVGLLWASPDCKHFSKAKGGKPLNRNIRDLAWVVVRWAKQVRPRVIILENVEEFQTWGPLGSDGTPCPKRSGETFKKWVRELRLLGYKVEWRELVAADYGAPTIRKRLFLIARCDGRPIVWPKPSHGRPNSLGVTHGKLQPWRTAAEIIDWSLPCHSIFLSKEEGREVNVKRPLAPNTMARIARGVKRYVIDAEKPFIIPLTHQGDERTYDIGEPMRTVTGAQRGEQALVTPFITKFRQDRPGNRIDEPLGTVTANSFIKRPGGAPTMGLVVPTLINTRNGERQGQAPRIHDIGAPHPTVTAIGSQGAVVAAFLAQHNLGMVGHDAREPVSTLTGKCSHQQVVSAGLLSLKGTDRRGQEIGTPSPAITAGGYHVGEVRAFLTKYYGTDQDPQLGEPLHTATTKDRFGVCTVEIAGEPYVIVDIGMRMLSPRELFNAQGFPADYIIDRRADGTPISKTDQIRMCGNSVCPDIAKALVAANYDEADVMPVAKPRRRTVANSAPLFEAAPRSSSPMPMRTPSWRRTRATASSPRSAPSSWSPTSRTKGRRPDAATHRTQVRADRGRGQTRGLALPQRGARPAIAGEARRSRHQLRSSRSLRHHRRVGRQDPVHHQGGEPMKTLPTMTPVQSSNVVEHGHDGATTMYVRFKNGLYKVEGVSPEKYADFAAAESFGKHFNAHFKGNPDHAVSPVVEEAEAV